MIKTYMNLADSLCGKLIHVNTIGGKQKVFFIESVERAYEDSLWFAFKGYNVTENKKDSFSLHNHTVEDLVLYSSYKNKDVELTLIG